MFPSYFQHNSSYFFHTSSYFSHISYIFLYIFHLFLGSKGKKVLILLSLMISEFFLVPEPILEGRVRNFAKSRGHPRKIIESFLSLNFRGEGVIKRGKLHIVYIFLQIFRLFLNISLIFLHIPHIFLHISYTCLNIFHIFLHTSGQIRRGRGTRVLWSWLRAQGTTFCRVPRTFFRI